MLPNLLVIGVQRSGTTWLYDVFKRHPQIYVPPYRKEVHFFDKYYDRGVEWYESFYKDAMARPYICKADITPMYIYDPLVPYRIKKTLGNVKFMAILRNPIERVISHYRLARRQYNIQYDFYGFIHNHEDALKRGFYAEQLKRYFELYHRNNFLILRYENLFSDPNQHMQRVSAFLGVSVDGFGQFNMNDRVNEGYIPRYGLIYSLGKKVISHLRDHDMDRVVNLIKRSGLHNMLGKKNEVIDISKDTKRYLLGVYRKDIEDLEKLLGWDCSDWLKQVS